MARPREFDADKAVLDAMNVFWAHGYDGASVSMLLGGMGLTKGSLYKAFTDKKTLFLTAMTLYEEKQVATAVDLLNDATITDKTERIARLFRSIPQAVRDGDRRGCLLCSAAAGPASNDDEIAAVVDRLLGQIRDGFEAALGPTIERHHRERLASLLIAQYVGLRILARARTSVAELDASVASLLVLLDNSARG
jgi:TetR/AcrR family transcriptional repressor of nem operon